MRSIPIVISDCIRDRDTMPDFSREINASDTAVARLSFIKPTESREQVPLDKAE